MGKKIFTILHRFFFFFFALLNLCMYCIIFRHLSFNIAVVKSRLLKIKLQCSPFICNNTPFYNTDLDITVILRLPNCFTVGILQRSFSINDFEMVIFLECFCKIILHNTIHFNKVITQVHYQGFSYFSEVGSQEPAEFGGKKGSTHLNWENWIQSKRTE